MTEAELIGLLEPTTRERYQQYRRDLAAVGIEERAIVTFRSPAVQAQKVVQNKSTMTIGWHQLGRAIDRQLKSGGKWDDKAEDVKLYLRAARIAERAGFRQIGFDSTGRKRFLKTRTGQAFWDPFHIEYRGSYPSLIAAIRKEAPHLA